MITARYDEKCPGCGGDIHAGDAIGKVDGDWCCESCVDEMGEDGEDHPDGD